MKNLLLGLVVLVICFSTESAGGLIPGAYAGEPHYIGVGQCRLCHVKQHRVWMGTVHSKAFGALKAEAKKDPKCLGCHVTGYKVTGQVTPELEGIQCEACHGPGSLYIKIHPKKDREGAKAAGMIAKPDPATCEGCHNSESPYFKGFKYESMWNKIIHPK